MDRLIQIVPACPPAVDGLGDYAARLGDRLREAHDLDSRYVDCSLSGAPPAPDAGILVLPQRRPQDLLRILDAADQVGAGGSEARVLLHYVNYAYQRRGLPLWLIEGLAAWKRAGPHHRLVVAFHELYAGGPPWSSAFWLGPWQRRLARFLARMADQVFTSNRIYADELAGWRRPDQGPIGIWPVLSNVGEPVDPPVWSERLRSMVVFGRPATRFRIYAANHDALASACHGYRIGCIHDIGPPLPGPPPMVPGVEVRVHGALSSEAVSELMGQSAFGCFDNGAGSLAKSGVFASIAAHGMVPVACRPYPEQDGLRPGQEFTVAGAPEPASGYPAVAAAALAWYRRHNTAVLAAGVADLVRGL